MRNLANISTQELRAILTLLGLRQTRINGGHEKWNKEGMLRPVIFQTHKEPVPELVIKNTIRNLGITRQEFLSVLEKL